MKLLVVEAAKMKDTINRNINKIKINFILNKLLSI